MPKLLTDLHIDKILYKGVGLARLPSGKKVLIKGNCIPNTTVTATITRNKRDLILAKLQSITDHNPKTTHTPVCPHYYNPLAASHDSSDACGGCKRQIIPYNQQLNIKQDIILDSCRKIPNHEYLILPIIPAPKEFRYRNKVECSFGTNATGQTTLGFHASGHFDRIVNIQSCHLMLPQMQQALVLAKELLCNSGLPAYNNHTHTGVLRHLVIRAGENTNHLMLNLVYHADNCDSHQTQRQECCQKLQNHTELTQLVTTCIITPNNGVADIVAPTANTTTLWGDGQIFETLNFQQPQKQAKTDTTPTTITCKIGPFSFFQVNTTGAQILFQQAATIMGGKQHQLLLDLYCGAGTIGLSLLRLGLAQKIIGIDIVSQAIDDARSNAKINNLQDQVYFSAGKAKDVLYNDQQIAQVQDTIDMVVVDPPRDGLHKKVKKFLMELKETNNITLLYISCNPVTMARDIMDMQSHFTPQVIQPVDMFPQTYHLENISLLT